jgi:hypothetical protein
VGIRTGRFYTRWFSIHRVGLLLALVLLAVACSPAGALPAPGFRNTGLSFPLGLFGVFVFLLSLRANTRSGVALHKGLLILIGLHPSIFFMLASFAIGFVGVVSGVFIGILSAGGDANALPEFLISLLPLAGFWIVSAAIAAGAWLAVFRLGFAQYRHPYDADRDSRFAVAAVLLLLFVSRTCSPSAAS